MPPRMKFSPRGPPSAGARTPSQSARAATSYRSPHTGSPQRSYRDPYARSKPFKTGESVTWAPLEEDNATLRYFAATEMKVHERGWSARDGLAPWNTTIHRPVPYALRGLIPITDEPWGESSGNAPEEFSSTASLKRLDDGQNDSSAMLFSRRKKEDEAIAANRGLKPWTYVPIKSKLNSLSVWDQAV